MKLGHLFQIWILLTAAILLYIEGVFNALALWNLVPLLIVWLLSYYFLIKKETINFAMLGFITGVTGAILFMHIAWYFDWFAIATGSSTAALIFLVLPFMAIIAGGILAFTGWIIQEFLSIKSKA